MNRDASTCSALAICVLGLLMATGCKKEEVPTYPPQIVSAQVTCGDAAGEDSPVVQEIGIEITDPDRDLLADSILVTANGLPIEGLADNDADDVYTWAPPTSWNPPMVCRGIFQFIVQVRDAEGHEVKTTLEVDKS